MNTPNFSEKEVSKFNDDAAQWWNEAGPMQPLHQLNPLRLQFVNDLTPLSDASVLDVGCGGGIFSEAMARKGAQVTGIDMNTSALAVAKQHAKQHDLSINYQQTMIEPWVDEIKVPYDVLTCMEMLEHVPDPHSIVQACAQAVKPGGWLFFSTINRTLLSFIKAIVGAEYVLRLLPPGTHEYAQFIRPSELNQWCLTAGLQLKSLQGIAYHPLKRQFTQTKKVDTNYLVAYQKPFNDM